MAQIGTVEGLGPRDGSGLGRWRASGLRIAQNGAVEGLGVARAGTLEGLGVAWAGTLEGLGPQASGWLRMGRWRASGWLGLGRWRASGWPGLAKGGAGAGHCVGFSLGLHCGQLALGIFSAFSGSGASLRDLSWGWSRG